MKRFLKNPYTKAGVVVILCGAALILFNKWVTGNELTIGFDAINSALLPIYIGIVLAFLMCPIYNRTVKYTYNTLKDMADNPLPEFNSFHSHRAKAAAERPREIQLRNNLKLARAIASAVCLVVVIGVIALLIYFVAPQLIVSTKTLLETAPDRLTALTEWLAARLGRYPTLSRKIEDMANLGFTEIMNWLRLQVASDKAQDFATLISTGVFSVLGAVINAFVGILVMVYLLNYKESLFAIGRKIVAATCKEKTSRNISEFVEVIDNTFVDFIVGRIIDSAIIGVLTFVLMCAFEFPYAPMISVVIGVTNIIPFFGPFIGAIPSTIILLIDNPTDAIWFVVMILLVQQLDGNVIGPKVMGSTIGINSFWVLVAVLVGGSLFGFLGMVFGVPTFAVIYKYVDKITSNKLSAMNTASDTDSYLNLDELGVDINEIELNDNRKGVGLLRRNRRGKKDAE